jgi:hypothetical protein
MPKLKANQKATTAKEQQLALAKIQARKTATFWDGLFKTVKALGGYATILGCFYFLYLTAAALAGKSTTFIALIKVLGNLSLDRWAAYAIAATTGGGWLYERRSKRRAIKGMSGHVNALESRQAPERRGSGLLTDGTPKQEDKDA